jgi:hypothetical protein
MYLYNWKIDQLDNQTINEAMANITLKMVLSTCSDLAASVKMRIRPILQAMTGI